MLIMILKRREIDPKSFDKLLIFMRNKHLITKFPHFYIAFQNSISQKIRTPEEMAVISLKLDQCNSSFNIEH